MAGHVFDATVVFADWSGEEQGLRGLGFFCAALSGLFSKRHAGIELQLRHRRGRQHREQRNGSSTVPPFFPKARPAKVSPPLVGSTDDTSPSRGIMRHIGYWGGAYVPTMTMLPQLREDRPGRSSDHKPFISRSVPGVRFIDVNEKPSHQHSPNDLFIYVTPAFTARVTQVEVASAASLARAPTPPLNMIATGISSITCHSSSPPASGSPVDHYVISARTSAETSTVYAWSFPATDLGHRRRGPGSRHSSGNSLLCFDRRGGRRRSRITLAYPEYRCDSTNTARSPLTR